MRAETALWLHDLGAVRVRGADAVRYLQGQLSQDIERVSHERSLLTGFHNVQGRVIALLRLIRIADDELIGILPRELAAPVATRLARFILRAKVAISDESGAWGVRGFIDDGRHDAAWPRARDAQHSIGDSRIVCVGDKPLRWVELVPGGMSSADDTPSLQAWQRCEVAAGEPQVFAATSEGFVSQMLNLDLVDAIAFDKGCYTGQEIIARAHYRGRMKRRMQRFTATTSRALAPGERGRLADGRSFTVVRAVSSGDSADFLAIASLPGVQEAAPDPAGDEVIDAVQQPLPYAFP